MILIKIGGSLIVKKNTEEEINKNYLQHISSFLKRFKKETIIVTHGTGNVGHGFVQKFGLNQNNRHQLRTVLDTYFKEIDRNFAGFKRVNAEDIVTGKYSIQEGEKIICGGDITSGPEIISSDDVFSYILHYQNIEEAYMLTDVDGVFDRDKRIISEITEDTFNAIHFRKKEGDVTGAMQQKIEKLFDHVSKGEKIVWIINGGNIDNFDAIIRTRHGIGSKIII